MELKRERRIYAEELLPPVVPPDTCFACRRSDYWTHPVTGRRICRTCHPPGAINARA